MTTIVWFRRDLRLGDQPALAAAAQRGGVVPVFVWDPNGAGEWAPGAAARWWLDASLRSLDRSLQGCGSRLIVRAGDSADELLRLAAESGADAVYWCRRYEPALRRRDAVAADALRSAGIAVEAFDGALLAEPESVRTRSGDPYRVFTPFWRTLSERLDSLAAPLPVPAHLRPASAQVASRPVEELGLRPKIAWDKGLATAWKPGETGAHERLRRFVRAPLADYSTSRDRADLDEATSRLSPHVAWGEISPRQIVWELKRRPGKGGDAFTRELGWREFAYHLLWHFPHTPAAPLDERFLEFEWRDDPQALARWQRGETGIPLVDAGMRELWQTGWLHNRARMIVASFLTKNLLVPWQQGARWFWDTLVDADLANNTLGWQWTAGCGADAAPFFRIFNPVTQAGRADPSGDYVRRFVPELAKLPGAYLHRPWEAPCKILERAGVRLGRDYPEPLVDLLATRRRALERFDRIKKGRR